MGSSIQTRAANTATFCANFKSGLPASMHIHGDADVDLGGGFLKLTLATNFQYGIAYVDDFNSGQPVTSFHATFKAALFGSGKTGNPPTPTPAEGFSFNLVPAASLLAPVTVDPGYNHPGEEGLNDGLVIEFDTFNNGGQPAPAIKVKWLGNLIYTSGYFQCSQSPLYISDPIAASKDVVIDLRPDGTLDVSYGGTMVVNNIQTPYRASVIGVPEWVLGARTSANYDNHWIADLCIQTVGDPSAPEACMDFNNGIPSGMTLFGDAQVDGGYLKLYTIGRPNGFGIAYLDDFSGGKQLVQGFTATFKASLFGSTACGPNSPADGFSFNLVPAATVLANPGYAQPAEEGLAEGLAINFDTFDNGGGEAPAIEIKWLGQIIARQPYQASQSPAGATDPVTASRDVFIQLKANGKVDVRYGADTIFSDVQTPYDPAAIGTPKWVMGARAGDCNDNHWLAGLCIQTVGGPSNPEACMDFNNGIPSGMTLFGDAQVDGGYLKLYTIGQPNGFGIAYLDDFGGGQFVQGFTATFKASLFGSTACGPNSPADGFSFNLVPAATVLANPGYAQPAEEGLAEGLAINFDTFDNGGGEAPAIEIKWLGQIIASAPYQASQSPAGATDPVTASRDVFIQLKANGKVDVRYGADTIFSDVQTPYDPAAIGTPKWAMGARAGDCNDNHWLDDLCITTTPAPDHQIPGLYNTGVSSQAFPLDYGAVDPHYKLMAASSDVFVMPQGASPVAWLADNRVSAWISPSLDTLAQADGMGTYSYSYDTTFDLTGFDPNRTRLAGRWSTDDVGLDIQINGFSISHINSPGFTAWTPFVITSHFASTINHLTFRVSNGVPSMPPGLDPTGLRVELWGATELNCPSTVAQPQLTISMQGGSPTLSWHQPGFVLQTGPSPMGPWQDVTRGVSPNGVDYSTTAPLSATAAFFRLRADCP